MTNSFVKDKIGPEVSKAILQNPFNRSLALHLLLLMMVAYLYTLEGSKGGNQGSPISVSLFKKAKSSNRISHVSHAEKGVSVSDLGMKMDWTSHVLEEAANEEETSIMTSNEVTFASFFGRVHDQLYRVWEPIVMKEAEKIYGLNGWIKKHPDFLTRAMITINAKGKIIKVELLQGSGTVELDEAALTALNEGGPYPNPPKALINASGNAQLPWSFILRN